MSRVAKSLSETFGVSDANVIDVTPTTPTLVVDEDTGLPPVVEETQLETDINFVRKKLHSLLEKGEHAMGLLSDIAEAEESPRSFEVMNTMLNTLSGIAMQLVDIHAKQAKIDATKKSVSTKDAPPALPSNVTTTNNIAFVGTSNDLQKILLEKLKDQGT